MKNTTDLNNDRNYQVGALSGLSSYLAKSSLPQQLLHLIYYRIRQLIKGATNQNRNPEANLAGDELVQKLIELNSWQKAIIFSDQEKAALAWSEAIAVQWEGKTVAPSVYSEASKYFNVEELVDLTLATVTINSAIHHNLPFPTESLTEQPDKFGQKPEVATPF